MLFAVRKSARVHIENFDVAAEIIDYLRSARCVRMTEEYASYTVT
jgi:hypothetical protein